LHTHAPAFASDCLSPNAEIKGEKAAKPMNPERRQGIQRFGRGGFDIAGDYFALSRGESLLRPERSPKTQGFVLAACLLRQHCKIEHSVETLKILDPQRHNFATSGTPWLR